MKPRIAVAVSGGVDSLMAAYFLKQQGHDLFGVHFKTGFEPSGGGTAFSNDAASDPISDIGRQLDIPIERIDCSDRFSEKVIAYFRSTYLEGKTPNPCMVCNAEIKFGVVLDAVREMGASALATGHYARTSTRDPDRVRLLKGIDPGKDQSYFLSRLTGRQLSFARFPLGGMRKAEVIRLAAEKGLRRVTRRESQDACFIGDRGYGPFLAEQTALVPREGLIVDSDGKRIGTHKGVHLFTVGQRRGINCPAPSPYYVIRIDPADNRIIVGGQNALLSQGCRVADINWIGPIPREPVRVQARLRYRHQAIPSTLVPIGENEAVLRFETPQKAVTPGQGSVFYQEDEVLGSGWIEGRG
jgi:tRNA-uridine 2-sulfurtransferase